MFPAGAGAESLVVVEAASLTDLMEPVGSPRMCDLRSDCGSLVPDDVVTVPDVALYPENIELGEPSEVVQSVVRGEVPDVEYSCSI